MILFYWFKEIPNIGDYLNIYLLNKITKDDIRYVDPKVKWQLLIKRIIKKILGYHIKCLFSDYLFPWKKCYFCIGSILDRSNKNTIVWGSGCREYDDKINARNIKAVRGLLSLEVLQKNNCGISNIKVGDPALLLPLFYTPQNKGKKYKIAVIPHYKDYECFSHINRSYHIIDVRTLNVETFIDEIYASEYVLSSSLHGLILAHAYGIPALWIRYNNVRSSEFKYLDYFSSVKIDPYLGFDNISELFQSEEVVIKLFSTNIQKALYHICIEKLQRDLLNVCPFYK